MSMIWKAAKFGVAALIIAAVIYAWREGKMSKDPEGSDLFGFIKDKQGFGAYEMALGASVALALWIASALLKVVPVLKKAAPNPPVGSAKK